MAGKEWLARRGEARRERESSEKLNALQEDVAQKERVNKDLLEEIFDKCLENNRLLNEMTVLEKKMDEMQKIVQQEREEHMNLSVKSARLLRR